MKKIKLITISIWKIIKELSYLLFVPVWLVEKKKWNNKNN